jgi:hypothetical protein
MQPPLSPPPYLWGLEHTGLQENHERSSGKQDVLKLTDMIISRRNALVTCRYSIVLDCGRKGKEAAELLPSAWCPSGPP